MVTKTTTKVIIRFFVPMRTLKMIPRYVQSEEVTPYYVCPGEFFKVYTTAKTKAGYVPVIKIGGKEYFPLRIKQNYWEIADSLNEALYLSTLAQCANNQKKDEEIRTIG